MAWKPFKTLRLVSVADSVLLPSVGSEGKSCICTAAILLICSETEIKSTANSDFYHRVSAKNLLAAFFASFTLTFWRTVLSFLPFIFFYGIVYGAFSSSVFQQSVKKFIVQRSFIRKGRVVYCPLQQEPLDILGTHLYYKKRKRLMSNLPLLAKMSSTFHTFLWQYMLFLLPFISTQTHAVNIFSESLLLQIYLAKLQLHLREQPELYGQPAAFKYLWPYYSSSMYDFWGKNVI